MKKIVRDTKFNPTLDRIVIRKDTDAIVSGGGVILPNGRKILPSEGVVEAVGPGVYQNGILCKPGVDVGDRVLYATMAECDIGTSQDLKLLREGDILTKIVRTETDLEAN